jgi:DNA invertase Pin-like site-specific DNA recombinase
MPRDIADELTDKGVKLSLGGSTCYPTDRVGRLLFNLLGMVAEFESNLIRMRTRERMAVAKAKGRLKEGAEIICCPAKAASAATPRRRAYTG